MENVEELIKEIGKKIELPLTLDGHGGCSFLLDSQLSISIDAETSGRFALIVGELGEVPSGIYRQNLLEAALKTNGLPPPLYGTLALSQQNDELLLFEYLLLKPISIDGALLFLDKFVEKAFNWHTALKTGSIPDTGGPRKSPSLFNL